MSWVAVAAAGAAIVGGYLQSNAAGDAADAQQAGADAATAEQRRQFDALREMNAPYLQAGGRGLAQYEALMGGDLSGFYNASPDYLAARGAMTYGMDHSAAAKGNLFSGGYGVDLAQKQGDLATNYLGNYRNSLFNLANMGQNSANFQGQAGMNMANQIGANSLYAGDAGASAAIGRGNALGGTLQGLAGLAGNYFGQQNNSVYGGGGQSNFGIPMPGSGSEYGQPTGWRW